MKIRGVKNFSIACTSGMANQKLSNVTYDAWSNQHKLSMSLLHTENAKATNTPIPTYAPIAQSLLTMDKSIPEKVAKKFDICYVLAKHGIP